MTALGAGVFILSAAVQWNDPDPAGWIILYLFAALASGLEAARRGTWHLPAAVTMVALGWAVLLLPMVRLDALPHLLEGWGMYSPGVEEAREFGGLLMVAGWSGVLTRAAWRRRAASWEEVT
ncbi:MAG: transmembrane 220 family protein [Gemmatimonadota bacterium]